MEFHSALSWAVYSFISDLNEKVEEAVVKYADDTKLWAAARETEDSKRPKWADEILQVKYIFKKWKAQA